ncbi:MAG: NAD+ synthase [Candidatus Omnitrophica bacterium]|nr:NAD+ synthase [Candidatus Omnitrophota bacterium]
MAILRLALSQLNVTVGDLEGNRRLVEAALRQARAAHADLLLVPELSLTGYPPEDLLLKPSFIERNLRMLRVLAPSAREVVAVVGFVDRDRQGRLYNAAAVLANGRHVATYRKQYLPNYGVFDEQRYFTPGSEFVLLELGAARVGLTICEDLWTAPPCELLAHAGANLVVNISASPYYAGKFMVRQRLFSRQARRNRVPIAYCNLVGGQDELVFDGASLVLDARGRRLVHGCAFREDTVFVDLPFAASRPRRPLMPVRRVRLPPPAPGPRAPLPPAPRRILGPDEEVYEALRLGLRDYVRKNGFSTVVFGLSGGIDSALTACLAVDALGAAHVRAMVMPSRFSSAGTRQDAQRLAKALKMQVVAISIEPVFQAYLNSLRPVFGRRPADVTEQNIQARIRGNLLMALSNKFGWLVLNTGNKSEMATGYTTLYGDMAGGLAVIKDVPKTLVYRLARWRNHHPPGTWPAEARRAKAGPIPERIFRRAPTAELASRQKDQDTLPPYDALDRILKASVEEDRSLQDTIARSRASASTVRRVFHMVDRAEYKRRQAPPGIKITPKAFGRDRRMPITNRYVER